MKVETALRHDWTRAEVVELLGLPSHDLLSEAQAVHRRHFDPNTVEGAILLSIKTGGCPEDCGYCSVVRLSAGRNGMSGELQALCLHAGANSVFLGDKLLTTPNPGTTYDQELLASIGVSLADQPLLST